MCKTGFSVRSGAVVGEIQVGAILARIEPTFEKHRGSPRPYKRIIIGTKPLCMGFISPGSLGGSAIFGVLGVCNSEVPSFVQPPSATAKVC